MARLPVQNYRMIAVRFIVARDGLKCHYCGHIFDDMRSKQIHIEHLKPAHRYPELQDDPSNLVLACAVCNSRKGKLTDEEYRKLKNRPVSPMAELIAIFTRAAQLVANETHIPIREWPIEEVDRFVDELFASGFMQRRKSAHGEDDG